MIKQIKIFGERNSGTNFITQLLTQNVKGIELCSGIYNGGTGWKHGAPKLNLFKNIKNTLFIFIIRDLEPWLKSMYVSPYHFIKSNTIDSFLNNKLKISEERPNHDVNINQHESNKTIFELRYYKITKMAEAFAKVDNAIIINLEDLQADGGETFIKEIRTRYSMDVATNFIPITTHTKTNEINKHTRDINIDIHKYDQVIRRQKNYSIEKFVATLKNNNYRMKAA
jgi:hypothetical protein